MKRTITTLLAIAALAATVVSIFPLKHGANVLPVVHAQNQGNGCSLSSLNGSYAVDKHGTILVQLPLPGVPPPPAPYGETSIAHFNGAGSFSGNATVNIGGAVVHTAFTGIYKVNSDCTGTVTVNALGLTTNEAIVVIGGGQGYISISTDQTIAVLQARVERIGN